jgi:hypothetical protein
VSIAYALTLIRAVEVLLTRFIDAHKGRRSCSHECPCRFSLTSLAAIGNIHQRPRKEVRPASRDDHRFMTAGTCDRGAGNCFMGPLSHDEPADVSPAQPMIDLA